MRQTIRIFNNSLGTPPPGQSESGLYHLPMIIYFVLKREWIRVMVTKFHTFTFEIMVEQAKLFHLTMWKIAVWN